MGIIRLGLGVLSLASVIGIIVVGCTNDLISVGTSEQERMDSFTDTRNRKASLKGMGVLVGRVTRGPTCPVERMDASCLPAPVPDARIVISRLDGQEIESVVTDPAGNYSTRLPAGTYRLHMPLLTGFGRPNVRPRTVTVIEGQGTRLDILIDTGIR